MSATTQATHTSPAVQQAAVYPEVGGDAEESSYNKRHLKRKLLIALAWTGVVLVCAFLVLFISHKVAYFESIGDMLTFIQHHFNARS